MLFLKSIIIYFILCFVDSFFIRNLKKYLLYKKAFSKAKKQNKKLVVVGSPHLSMGTGGVVGYVTEKIIGPIYGCGDVCVDLIGCLKCPESITGDILNYLRSQEDNSCVLFSTGVFEFVPNYKEIKKEIDRTCIENYTDYYSPWNITWYVYGCNSSKCGLFVNSPNRVFWLESFKSILKILQ